MPVDVDNPSPVDPGDLALAQACAAGDVTARRRFVREYYPHLLRFFGNKVPRQHVADLVQDVFVGLFSGGLGAYGGRGRLRSFVLAVAYHRVLKHFREDHRVARRDSWEGEPEELRPSPSRVAAQRTRQKALCAQLKRLPRDAQIVLEFYYWNRLSTHEIAEILGAKVGTVRWRLAEARERLRRLLQDADFDAREWIELTSRNSSDPEA